jgi:A/G-specific adenine glycosylase
LTKNRPIVDTQTLATRRHTFSHYHLDYTPVVIQTDNLINFVMEDDQAVWYNAGQINSLGLPAPIKLLLQQHTRG